MRPPPPPLVSCQDDPAAYPDCVDPRLIGERRVTPAPDSATLLPMFMLFLGFVAGFGLCLTLGCETLLR